MDEEFDKWAEEKAKIWVGNLRRFSIKNPYKRLGYDSLTYMIKRAFKKGYQKALDDLNKKK